MHRAGGKRDDGVKRRARVRHLQIELGKKYRTLAEKTDVDLDLATVTSCSDGARQYQAKHDFMAFPERAVNIQYLSDDLKQRRQTIADLRNRISEAETELIEQENQATLEVTDATKATKLARNLFDLYTTEWTKMYEQVRNKVPAKLPDHIILAGIRDVMELCYDTCRSLSRKQGERMLESLNIAAQGTPLTSPLQLRIKEHQLITSPFSLAHIVKIIKTDLAKNFVHLFKKLWVTPYKTPLVEFLERFVELCWYSQIRDPPVEMAFTLLGDTSLYEAFNERGASIDYVIWPVLFLKTNGPLLAKGVAKFNEDNIIPESSN